METQNNKSTAINTDQQTTGRKSLFIGGNIVILIAVSPLIFYSYKNFPESQTWETSLFTLETNFPDWFGFIWYLVNKFVPLYLLLLWFVTCKHWWHWIILIPIGMYAFQLWGILNQNKNVDELEIYLVFPLMLVIIPLVYLIRAKLFSKVRGDDLRSFEEELGTQKSVWGQIKDLFR